MQTGAGQRRGLFRQEAIRFLDTSSHSVEEISAKILEATGLRRQLC